MKTNFKTLSIKHLDETLLIILNRPEQLNAMTALMLEELEMVITDFEKDLNYKGAIITGSGNKAFAAGADLSQIREYNSLDALKFSEKGQSVFSKIENCSKLIVAAVNGFAIGGGCELAMACHMRVAVENAIFGQPEVGIGLICGSGGTQRLRHLVGYSKAIEMLVTGESISVDDALKFGLINYITKPENLIEKALSILQKTYEKSQLAIHLTLQTISEGLYKNLKKGYELEKHNFGLAFSKDGKEGISAFLEKRIPAFQ